MSDGASETRTHSAARGDRRAERQGALRLTAGAGCLVVTLYLFGHTDTLFAATALYIGLMLLWSRGWIE